MKKFIAIILLMLSITAQATTICYKDGDGPANIRCYQEAGMEMLMDFINYCEVEGLKYRIITDSKKSVVTIEILN